jgi:hypothetical protein
MSWHFSRALVAGFSEATYLDGAPSAPSNTTPTPEAFYWPDKTTEHSRLSRFGMTSEPLMGVRGEDLLMWFREVSLAKTSAQPAKVTGSTVSEVGSGRKWLGLLARYDRDSLSWRTPQCSLLEGSDEFSGTWPRWGSMRNGESWERQTLERRTSATESGLWPTPTATDFKSESMSADLVQRRQAASSKGVRLTEHLHRKMLPTPTAGNDHSGGRLDEWGGSTNPFRGTEIGHLRLNPCWVEQLMGWTTDWTDLKPLATAKFREWQQQHSICSHEVKNAA